MVALPGYGRDRSRSCGDRWPALASTRSIAAMTDGNSPRQIEEIRILDSIAASRTLSVQFIGANDSRDSFLCYQSGSTSRQIEG